MNDNLPGAPAVHLSLHGTGRAGKSLIASFPAQCWEVRDLRAESTPVPLWRYMVENKIPSALRESNRRLVIHTVVTLGQALADTVMGFKSLAESCESRTIVAWINEYFGPVERGGEKFSQMSAFLERRSQERSRAISETSLPSPLCANCGPHRTRSHEHAR